MRILIWYVEFSLDSIIAIETLLLIIHSNRNLESINTSNLTYQIKIQTFSYRRILRKLWTIVFGKRPRIRQLHNQPKSLTTLWSLSKHIGSTLEAKAGALMMRKHQVTLRNCKVSLLISWMALDPKSLRKGVKINQLRAKSELSNRQQKQSIEHKK